MIVTDHPDSTAIRLDGPDDVEPARKAALDAIARRRCRVGLFAVDRRPSGSLGMLACAATILPGFTVVTESGGKPFNGPRSAVDYAVATARYVMDA